MESFVWLFILLLVEILGRIVLEIRESRLTQRWDGILSILRVIPLLNDFVPLPENSREPVEGNFVRFHEEGHQFLHHAVLRNVFKILLLMLAVGWIAFVMARMDASFLEAILWLHLVAIPGRMFFHSYCWKQEYEADTYAYRKLDKKVSRNALRELAACEFSHTKFFALMYREHPTAVLRMRKLNVR